MCIARYDMMLALLPYSSQVCKKLLSVATYRTLDSFLYTKKCLDYDGDVYIYDLVLVICPCIDEHVYCICHDPSQFGSGHVIIFCKMSDVL